MYQLKIFTLRASVATMMALTSPFLLSQNAATVPHDHSPDSASASGYTSTRLARLVPRANQADVVSPRALVLALHASVTGQVESFDWQRFRSLFLPGARIGQAGTDTGAPPDVLFESLGDFLKSMKGKYPGAANHEEIFKMHVEQYGNIANVFYSHSAVLMYKGQIDNVRRVNSCQMLFDGKRWWITSVIWNVSPQKWDLPTDLEP
jgi:hypothetical protein